MQVAEIAMKRASEADWKEFPCKSKRVASSSLGRNSTIIINCGGKQCCRKETHLHLVSSFFKALGVIDAGDLERGNLLLDFRLEAFEMLLNAFRVGRTNVVEAVGQVRRGLMQLNANLGELLNYLVLEWLVSTNYNLLSLASWPVAASTYVLCKLNLAGVVEDLTAGHLSRSSYLGDCSIEQSV